MWREEEEKKTSAWLRRFFNFSSYSFKCCLLCSGKARVLAHKHTTKPFHDCWPMSMNCARSNVISHVRLCTAQKWQFGKRYISSKDSDRRDEIQTGPPLISNHRLLGHEFITYFSYFEKWWHADGKNDVLRLAYNIPTNHVSLLISIRPTSYMPYGISSDLVSPSHTRRAIIVISLHIIVFALPVFLPRRRDAFSIRLRRRIITGLTILFVKSTCNDTSTVDIISS